MTQPFSLRIFVAEGDPDGLRIVERSNWIGKAVVFPRALLPKVKQREEFAQTGVYLLIGPLEDGEGEMLHIGEGDPAHPRFESQYAQKDFWTWAAYLWFINDISAGDISELEALESRCLIRPLCCNILAV